MKKVVLLTAALFRIFVEDYRMLLRVDGSFAERTNTLLLNSAYALSCFAPQGISYLPA